MSVTVLSIAWAVTALIFLGCQIINLYAWWAHREVHRLEREAKG